MKKFSVLVLAVVLMLSLSGIALAGGEVSGTVTAVDANAKTVKVKTDKGEEAVAIAADTKIMVGTAEKALGDIKTGDMVTIQNPGAAAKKKKPAVGC
jgi:uncharacterized protein (UPF0333 family)